MISVLIYSVQIIALLVCMYMAWRARAALHGLARGLMALMLLLIVRRLDDAFGLFSQTETLILSSAVVMIVLLDVYRIYQARDVYRIYAVNRKRRIAELEEMRRSSEKFSGNWDTLTRFGFDMGQRVSRSEVKRDH